jgi:hypothetical protein
MPRLSTVPHFPERLISPCFGYPEPVLNNRSMNTNSTRNATWLVQAALKCIPHKAILKRPVGGRPYKGHKTSLNHRHRRTTCQNIFLIRFLAMTAVMDSNDMPPIYESPTDEHGPGFPESGTQDAGTIPPK